jgi:hypothetical protein
LRAREVATSLGYNYYRKTSDGASPFGVRQPRRDAGCDKLRSTARVPARRSDGGHLYQARRQYNRRSTPCSFTHGDSSRCPLPGDEPPLSHGPRPAIAARRQPRC